MFSFGRRDDVVSSSQQVLKLALSSPKGITPRFRGLPGFQPSPRNAKIMEVDDPEGGDGVEVCLGNTPTKGGGPASPMETREPPQVPLRAEAVISMECEISRYETVQQSQGSVQTPSVLTIPSTMAETTPSVRQLQDHRIPLFGADSDEAAYDDVVALLQHFHVSSEVWLVKLELDLLQAEYAALERDRQLLLQQEVTLDVDQDPILPLRSPRVVAPSTTTTNTIDASLGLQQLLESATLTNVERERLQGLRGNCWTFHIEQPRLREALLQKCGAKLSEVLKSSTSSMGNGQNNQKPRPVLQLPPADCLTLGPHNCRAGGAAMHVRHLHMTCDNMQGQQQAQSAASSALSAISPRGRQQEHQKQQPPSQGAFTVSGFVMSNDTGRTQTWGRLPTQLFDRLQQQQDRGSANPCTSGDIQWLATGPLGSYVCKFSSGELWWRLSQDEALTLRLQSWDIDRVVFGPLTQTENGFYPSWLVIGHDGKVAWKNIPSSLQTSLLSRPSDSPAVESVSLGAGGSYFVRYRDLTIDYCVSAEMAEVCDYIHSNGGTVTDMILHPESTSDFIIRHSELK